MSIYRVRSGLLFDDGMDTLNERWVVSPSSSYEVREDGVQIKHSNVGETKALFEVPDESELLFEVTADYTPTLSDDMGGLLVWKSAVEKLEFLESVDTTKQTEYSRWRVQKRNNLWMFFAYSEGEWELVDSTICIEPSLLGVVVKGYPNPMNSPLIVNRSVLCKGDSVTIGNVDEGYEIALVTEGGEEVYRQTVPNGYSGLTINLPSIPFYGKVVIYDKEGQGEGIVYETEEPVNIYGGDEFLLGTDLIVKWNGEELDPYNPTHLGSLKSNHIEEKMTVVNPTSSNIAENTVLRIAMYEEYLGWNWAEIAKDEEGSPTTFSKEVHFGTLMPGDERDFWVRVRRGSGVNDLKPTYFLIDIKTE